MANLSTIEIIYWSSAIIGGVLLILRVALLLMAGGEVMPEGDFDLGSDLEAPDAGSDASHISLQGITAFFMMFGLVGLALFHFGFHIFLTLLGGTAAGIFTMWVIGLIFTSARFLQSEGNLQLKNAVGQVGTVYLSIPKDESGQVQIAVQGALRIINARSAGKKPIATGEKIRVVSVLDDTLLVEKIDYS